MLEHGGGERLMSPRTWLIRPVISEKELRAGGSRQVHLRNPRRRPQDRGSQAVEQLFDVGVLEVRTAWVKASPSDAGRPPGATRRWKKAIVQVREGETIRSSWPR